MPPQDSVMQGMAKTQRWLSATLKILLGEILVLMALGAFVRAMNAGLSCPDWPLCFGKVIPDFHPAVWYEFIHRADAGLVAITYLAVFLFILFSRSFSGAVKATASGALIVLLLLISAGALTVLKQVAWLVVTTHLMLATTFFCLVLRILFQIDARVELAKEKVPGLIVLATAALAAGVFAQIMMGGIVASTYAGSVCVDWPLCNGQWIPTWSGAIGHQILHRFLAYTLAAATLALGAALHANRAKNWATPQLLRVSRVAMFLVVAQVALGIANLVYFIPPWLTVPHQTLALVLLATDLRLFQIAGQLKQSERSARKVSGSIRLDARPGLAERV